MIRSSASPKLSPNVRHSQRGIIVPIAASSLIIEIVLISVNNMFLMRAVRIPRRAFESAGCTFLQSKEKVARNIVQPGYIITIFNFKHSFPNAVTTSPIFCVFSRQTRVSPLLFLGKRITYSSSFVNSFVFFCQNNLISPDFFHSLFTSDFLSKVCPVPKYPAQGALP